MKNELVSVIIPTCDRPKLLKRALKSVENQTYKNIEIIIVNDGLISDFSEFLRANVTVVNPKIKSTDALGYGSGGYSRNKGVEVAKGNYIAFLDDDDFFIPSKIDFQLNLMKERKLDFICTDGYISIWTWIKNPMKIKMSNFYRDFHNKVLKDFSLKKIPYIISEQLLERHNFVITSTVMTKRNVIENVGGFNNIKNGGMLVNGKAVFEDWDLWIRISKKYQINYIDEPTILYKRGSLVKFKNKVARTIPRFLSK